MLFTRLSEALDHDEPSYRSDVHYYPPSRLAQLNQSSFACNN